MDNTIKYLLIAIISIVTTIIVVVSYLIFANYESNDQPAPKKEEKKASAQDIQKSAYQRQGRIEEIKKVGRDLGGN